MPVRKILPVILLFLVLVSGRVSGEDGLEKARYSYLVGDWRRAAEFYVALPGEGLGQDDLNRLAEAYYQLGQTERAAGAAERALKISDNKETRVLRALIDAQREGARGPMRALEGMISGTPDDSLVLTAMGMVLMKDDTRAALEHFSRALDKNPDDFRAWFYSGVIHEQEERFVEATRAYQQAVKINPLSAVAQNNLGYSFKERHFYAYAVEHYLKAIALMPDIAGFYYNLGNAYTDQEKIEEAFSAYRKAVELDPSFAKAHYKLGRTSLRKDMVKEAIEEFRLYLKYGNSAVFRFVAPVEAVEEEIEQLEYYLKYNSSRPVQGEMAR